MNGCVVARGSDSVHSCWRRISSPTPRVRLRVRLRVITSVGSQRLVGGAGYMLLPHRVADSLGGWAEKSGPGSLLHETLHLHMLQQQLTDVCAV